MAQQSGTDSATSAPPGPKPRIFVSCVSPEFRSARAKVADVLQFLGYEVEKQEIFGTEPGDLRQMLRDKIDACDGLIQIVGEGYGAEPPGPDENYGRVSYTQFEFLHARDRGKKTWLLFAGPDAAGDTPVSRLDLPPDCPDPEHPDAAALGYQAERRALQTAYRDERRADGHLRWTFRNDTELELVIHKLRQELEEQREQFQRWQQDLAGGQQQIHRRQKSGLALTLTVSAVIVLLGIGSFFGLKHLGETNTRRIEEKQELTRERIRAHLIGSSENALAAALDEAESGADSQERIRLREAAQAAHRERLSRIGALANTFAELEAGAETSDVFLRMKDILDRDEPEVVDEALAYLESQRPGILGTVAARNAANRRDLQPFLTGAEVSVATGKNEEAESLFRDVLKADPAWSDARHAFLKFLGNIRGPRAETHATLAEAGAIYEEAHRLALRLVEDDPGNAEWQRDLSVSHERLGDIAVAQGDLDKAAQFFESSRNNWQSLIDPDGSNTDWQRGITVPLDRLGDVAAAQGDLGTAAARYADSLAIREKLVASDPGNAEWQRDLSVSHNNLGNVAAAQGDLDTAAAGYADGLAIAETLTASDPGNVAWQRDLSVSHDRLSDVALAQGDLDTAAARYADGLAIRKSLAASDPGNAQWQRDLSISHDRLGDVAVAQGDLETAAAHYADGLAIRETLAASDPGNAEWQRDLSISHEKLARLAERQGDDEIATNHWKASYDIQNGIRERGGHVSPDDLKFLKGLEDKLGIGKADEN